MELGRCHPGEEGHQQLFLSMSTQFTQQTCALNELLDGHH